MASDQQEESAATRVIRLEELANAILNRLDSRSLTNVARSASFLHLAACRYIWYAMTEDSIEYLVDIMLSRTSSLESDPPYDIHARWRRFFTYTSMVSSLTLTMSKMDVNLPARLYSLLALQPSGRRLLPNLLCLSVFDPVSPQGLDLAGIFIHAGLRQVRVIKWFSALDPNERDWHLHASLFGAKVCKIALSLKEFRISLGPDTKLALLPILKEIIETRSLACLGCDLSILSQPSIITALITTNRVRSLYVECPVKYPTNVPSDPSSGLGPWHALSYVKSLAFRGSMQIVIGLVSDFRLLELVFLEVLISQTTPFRTSDISDLCCGMASFPVTCQEMQLGIHNPMAELDTDSISWDEFIPLLSHKTTRVFHFTFASHRVLDMNDAHLQMIAALWPSLQDLQLVWYNKGIQGDLLQPKNLTTN